MNKSERATAKQLDRQWEDALKRQESKSLGRISHILVSIYDLRKLWVALKNGESLILTSDGAIYKGRPNLEKLTKLQERYTADRVEYQYAESDPDTSSVLLPYSRGNSFSAHNNWSAETYEVNPDGTRKRVPSQKSSEPLPPPDEL